MPVGLRTEEMCTTAVRQHPGAMQFVPGRYRDAVRDALMQDADASTEPETKEEDSQGPRP